MDRFKSQKYPEYTSLRQLCREIHSRHYFLDGCVGQMLGIDVCVCVCARACARALVCVCV